MTQLAQKNDAKQRVMSAVWHRLCWKSKVVWQISGDNAGSIPRRRQYGGHAEKATSV